MLSHRCTFTHIRIRDEGRTGQARARGRRGGRRRSEYVPAPTHLRGSSLIRKFRMARNRLQRHIVATRRPHERGQARTLDNGMPTYHVINHESTMYGTKSIAPTYSALFRFEILYAAYLNIDLNTLLDVSRAVPRTTPSPTAARRVESKLSRAAASRTSPPAGPRCPAARALSACASLRPVAARTHRGQILKTLTTQVSVDSRFADVKLLSRPTEAPTFTMAVSSDRGADFHYGGNRYGYGSWRRGYGECIGNRKL